ncbi:MULTISPECIES: RHS repeat domain-containing protein [Paenibacillus]|uniref:RHS repeat protein n=1 Tax=Paenibacillus alvei TaxID=44250 RepID=A0ABT4E337_PAEAL|nr:MULTISPECIES: RHS repeat domain-containing protein [Paenibacillus]EPY14896.1 Rhs family protein [Paenibacillus alvei A6-6i-x]MCY9528150.1 RHS repeat protein [Paenibacillus alvei]SDF47770.1 YD repeat-containing protein [Paenibacillus sp. cl6col]
MYTTKIETQAIGATQKRITEYEYDRSRGRAVPTRIKESSYDGGRWSPDRYTHRTYNRWGFITAETNPLGVTNNFQYDFVSEKKVALLSSTQPSANNESLHSSYQYNFANGEFMQLIMKNNHGALLQQINYAYDAVGNPITIHIKGDQRDTVVQQEFHPRFKSSYLNKQSVQVANVDGAVSTIEQHLEYEPYLGLVIKSIDGNGNETHYTYDKLGRVT